MLGPIGACVWCGGTKVNREHIIGDQVRKAMGLQGTYRLVLGSTFVGRDEPVLNFILRQRICQKCNGGWMKDIDDAFIKHLHSGFKDLTPLSLDPFGQSWIARWAVKTTLLSELRVQDWVASSNDPRVKNHEVGYLPEGHIEHMGQTHLIPPNTQVWLAASARTDSSVMGSRGSVHFHITGDSVHGAATALFIGPFAFAVVAHDVHHPDRREEVWDVPRIEMPEDYGPAFAPIYPAVHPVVRWPQEWVISGEDFDAMTRPLLEQYRRLGPTQ